MTRRRDAFFSVREATSQNYFSSGDVSQYTYESCVFSSRLSRRIEFIVLLDKRNQHYQQAEEPIFAVRLRQTRRRLPLANPRRTIINNLLCTSPQMIFIWVAFLDRFVRVCFFPLFNNRIYATSSGSTRISRECLATSCTSSFLSVINNKFDSITLVIS